MDKRLRELRANLKTANKTPAETAVYKLTHGSLAPKSKHVAQLAELARSDPRDVGEALEEATRAAGASTGTSRYSRVLTRIPRQPDSQPESPQNIAKLGGWSKGLRAANSTFF